MGGGRQCGRKEEEKKGDERSIFSLPYCDCLVTTLLLPPPQITSAPAAVASRPLTIRPASTPPPPGYWREGHLTPPLHGAAVPEGHRGREEQEEEEEEGGRIYTVRQKIERRDGASEEVSSENEEIPNTPTRTLSHDWV